MPNDNTAIDASQLLKNVHGEIVQKKELYDKFVTRITKKDGEGDKAVLTALPYTECAITALNIIYETLISPELVSATNPNGESAMDVLKAEVMKKYNPHHATDWEGYKALCFSAKEVDTFGYTIIGICLGGIFIDKYSGNITKFMTIVDAAREHFCPMKTRIDGGKTEDKRLDIEFEPLFADKHIFDIMKELIKNEFDKSAKLKKANDVNPQEEQHIKSTNALMLELLKEGVAIRDMASDEGTCKAIGKVMDDINSTLKRYNADSDVKWAFDKVRVNKVSSLSVLYNLYSAEVNNILEKDDADKKSTIQRASLLVLDNLHEGILCSSRMAAAFPSLRKIFKDKANTIYETMFNGGMISESVYNTLVKNLHSVDVDVRLLDILLDEDAVQAIGDLSLFQAEMRHVYSDGEPEYNTFGGREDPDAIQLVRDLIKLHNHNNVDGKRHIERDDLFAVVCLLFRSTTIKKSKNGDSVLIRPDFQFIEKYIDFDFGNRMEYDFDYMMKKKKKVKSKVNVMERDTPLLLNTINIIHKNMKGTINFSSKGIAKLKGMIKREGSKSARLGDINTATCSKQNVKGDISATNGSLTLFVAPTNQGKTARLMHMTMQGWKNGENVVVFSGEDTQDMLVKRMMQNAAVYTSLDDVENINRKEERERFFHAMILYRYINGAGSFALFTQSNELYSSGMLEGTLPDCERHLLKMKKNRSPDIVNLDYVNSFEDDDERADYGEQVVKDSQRIAQTYNCKLITAMQANLRKENSDAFGTQKGYHFGGSIYNISNGGIKKTADKGDIINQKFTIRKRKDGVKEGDVYHSVFYESLQWYADIPHSNGGGIAVPPPAEADDESNDKPADKFQG